MNINFTPQPLWAPPVAPYPLPYISIAAVKRVKDRLPPPTTCPGCNGSVKLVNNCEIYERSIGDWPFAYACQRCGEYYVGVHPDTDIPLGTLASKELREARQLAKTAFHDMIKKGLLHRADSYVWLSNVLDIPLSVTHFGMMDKATCTRALEAITKRGNTQ